MELAAPHDLLGAARASSTATAHSSEPKGRQTELMRAAALTGYCQTMRALGADPFPLLKEVGLSQALLSQPEQMISARAALRLLERSAEVTGCVTFGLRMVESRELADLGAPSLLIAHQPTLREGLSALMRYRNRINSSLFLSIEDIADGVVIRGDVAVGEPETSRQASDLVLGVLAHLCATLLGDCWRPEMVCFTCAPPPAPELPIYHRLFGCRAEFNAEFNGIVIDPHDLDRSNARADRALAGQASRLIAAAMSPERQSIAQQVNDSIMLLLPSGRATIQTCSELLGMGTRTLQRALDAEGATFTGLLNRVRMQLAGQYLANPNMRITDVADLLGYSSIGAFTRWHHETYGVPPKARRRPEPN